MEDNFTVQSTGVLFIRWNLTNRVAIAVAYFENGKMVYMNIDKEKVKKICRTFIPHVSYKFILQYPNSFKELKLSELDWNKESFSQNGIIEIKKTNAISIRLTEKKFNDYASIYLK